MLQSNMRKRTVTFVVLVAFLATTFGLTIGVVKAASLRFAPFKSDRAVESQLSVAMSSKRQTPHQTAIQKIQKPKARPVLMIRPVR